MLRVDIRDNINMDINKIVTGFERVGRSVRTVHGRVHMLRGPCVPFCFLYTEGSDRVVSLVHRLRAGGCGVRIAAGATDFSLLLTLQTRSGAHPASCAKGTGILSPGGKAASA